MQSQTFGIPSDSANRWFAAKFIYFVHYSALMSWFWQTKTKENVEPTCLERVSRLEARITKLEAENLDLCTAIDIIRNKVLRKIQFKKEVDDTSTDSTTSMYNGMLLPEK